MTDVKSKIFKTPEETDEPEAVKEALRALRASGLNYVLVVFPKKGDGTLYDMRLLHNATKHESAFGLIEELVKKGREYLKLQELDS